MIDENIESGEEIIQSTERAIYSVCCLEKGLSLRLSQLTIWERLHTLAARLGLSLSACMGGVVSFIDAIC